MLSDHFGFQRKFNFGTIMMEIINLVMFPKKMSTRGTLFVKLMTFPVVSRDSKLATAVLVVKCSRLQALLRRK